MIVFIVFDDENGDLRVPDIGQGFCRYADLKVLADGGGGELSEEHGVGAEGGHVDGGDAGGVGFGCWGEVERHGVCGWGFGFSWLLVGMGRRVVIMWVDREKISHAEDQMIQPRAYYFGF